MGMCVEPFASFFLLMAFVWNMKYDYVIVLECLLLHLIYRSVCWVGSGSSIHCSSVVQGPEWQPLWQWLLSIVSRWEAMISSHWCDHCFTSSLVMAWWHLTASSWLLHMRDCSSVCLNSFWFRESSLFFIYSIEISLSKSLEMWSFHCVLPILQHCRYIYFLSSSALVDISWILSSTGSEVSGHPFEGFYCEGSSQRDKG